MKQPFLAGSRGLVRACLFTAAGGLACLIFHLCKPTGLLQGAADYFSAPVRRVLSAIANPLPFSLAEVMCLAAAVGAFAFLLQAILMRLKGHRVLGGRLVFLAGLALWVYAGVCWLWGTVYYTADFEQLSGITAQPVTLSQLEETALWFQQKANEASADVPRGDDGLLDYTWQQAVADSGTLYDGVTEEYPFLAGPVRKAKPALLSYLMSMANFTGYIFPFTGESTINIDDPKNLFVPVTIAHEYSHQRGIGPEQHANFVAVEACIASGIPEYVYSGYAFAYLHLANAIYETDPDAWEIINAGMCADLSADMDSNNRYWQQFKTGKVKKAAEVYYNNFLYSYDQSMGMRSYGACVDLLVAKYYPLIEAGAVS